MSKVVGALIAGFVIVVSASFLMGVWFAPASAEAANRTANEARTIANEANVKATQALSNTLTLDGLSKEIVDLRTENAGLKQQLADLVKNLPTMIAQAVKAAQTSPAPAAAAPAAPQALPPAGQPQPQGVNLPSMEWATFVSATNGMNDPYQLINWLDQQSQKVDHKVGGWTSTTGADQAMLVWTGSYIPDPTYGGDVRSWLVDGKTGTWLQKPGTSVVWQTPGGSILVTGFTSSSVASASGGGSAATACVDTDKVVAIINSNKKVSPDRIYTLLDEIVDNQTTARIRGDQPATIDGKNVKTLIWVKSGSVSGNVMPLDITNGKTLYVVTKDGPVQVGYPYSGMALCSPLDPARDFPWWGK